MNATHKSALAKRLILLLALVAAFLLLSDSGVNAANSNEQLTPRHAYDHDEKLVMAGDETYERDPLDRAVSSTDSSSGTTTEYLFDGSEVLQETTSGESASYTRGLEDQLISRRQGTSPPSYYHHDAIGSVTELSDSSGELSDTYSYDAFGNELRTRSGASEQPYGYVGNRQLDPQTGLSDFHTRAYDPYIGCFTSENPERAILRGTVAQR